MGIWRASPRNSERYRLENQKHPDAHWRSGSYGPGSVPPSVQDTLNGSSPLKDSIRRKANCRSQKKARNMLPERETRNHGKPERTLGGESRSTDRQARAEEPSDLKPTWVRREVEKECFPETQNTLIF